MEQHGKELFGTDDVKQMKEIARSLQEKNPRRAEEKVYTGECAEDQEHTSKGDQPKWQRKGKWYRADYMGYEALSEVLISRLHRAYMGRGWRRLLPKGRNRRKEFVTRQISRSGQPG